MKVIIGLTSVEGDRLGHLVRGVQMLRSYGSELEVDAYSDVVELPLDARQTPVLAVVLTGRTSASLEALRGICRETEWSLGDEDDVLAVWLLQYGRRRLEPGGRGLWTLLDGRRPGGMIQAMAAADFARICDWGQQLVGYEVDVMGEWPSGS